MHPSPAKPTSEMMTTSPAFMPVRSNSNLSSPNFYPNPSLPSNETNRYSYPDLASSSSLNYLSLLHTWNYHRFLTSTLKTDQPSDDTTSEYYPRTSSFHQFNPRLVENSFCAHADDENMLSKFHHDMVVNLETSEPKNIQHLTTSDFLTSAKQNQQYSSLLARVDHIGAVDQATGKVQLRFYIDDIEKMTSSYVLQEMPFFVYQFSCWSSISPELTHRKCGLKCRQLECGDLIIAITEQAKSPSSKINDKPNYSQQSPTKCLVGRYLNGQTSSSASSASNKRHKGSNE